MERFSLRIAARCLNLRFRMFPPALSAMALVLALLSPALGENWPAFRGPGGQGISTDKELPLKWNAKTGENVLWKAPIRGQGHASPIIWGDRLFICTVQWPAGTADQKKVIPDHFVTCYDARDGKRLWETQIDPGKWVRDDFRSGPGGGYACPTPCTDGKLVYAVFGSSVIAALDFEGKLAWRKEIEPHSFDVTIGTSPILHGQTVLFVCAMAKKNDSKIIAFDKATGDVKWETKTPDMAFAHSTPLIIEVAGRPQMLMAAGAMGSGKHALQSFDPADGRRLWWCKGGGEASSPVFGSGIVYFDSGRGGAGTAVEPGGEGDVSETSIKWTTGNFGEAIGSPVIVDGRIYRLISGGVLRCWDAKTGEQVFSGRIGVSTTWASPVADGQGRIYFASAGKSVVVQAGAELKVLAENDLGDANHASPAASGGRLYFLGGNNVYCVGKAEIKG